MVLGVVLSNISPSICSISSHKAGCCRCYRIIFAAMSLGGAIGVSIGGGFWNNYLPERLVEFLPEEAQKNATSIFKSITVARATKGEIREAVNTAYRLTLKNWPLWALAF